MEAHTLEQSLQHFQESLRTDGCSEDRLQEICTDQMFQIQRTISPVNLAKYIERWDGTTVLSKLPFLVTEMQKCSREQADALQANIIAKIRSDVFARPWTLSTDATVMNFIRSRHLLALWFGKEEMRAFILTFLRKNLDEKTHGPLGGFALFGSLYYQEFLELFPNDQEFRLMFERALTARHSTVPLHATTPISIAPDVGGRRFWETDERIALPGVVRTHKRADRRFTWCSQAENAHMVRSLSPNRGGNTFVFSGGVLIGSLKHGESPTDDFGNQETFLGMRTIRNEDDTFPVIEGGLYLLADENERFAVTRSGDRCDVNTLALMPIRSVEGLLYCSEDQYVGLIRARRQQLEQR